MPPDASDVVFSMLDTLTDPRPGVHRPVTPFESTELINFLLTAVAQDISTVSTNSQVSYRFVGAVRDVRDKITGLIHNVDISQDEVSDDNYNDYEAYTSAIGPLEDLLLDFLLPARELTQISPQSLSDTVDGCVGITDKWKTQRKALRDALKKLSTNEELKTVFPEGPPSDGTAAARHDDLTLLQTLVNQVAKLQMEGEEFTDLARSKVESVKTSMKDILSRSDGASDKDEFMVFSIRCAFILAFVVSQCTSEQETLTPDKEKWRKGVKSNKVWDAADKLLNSLKEKLNDAPFPEELETKLQEFITLLKGLDGAPSFKVPVEWLKLVKASARVGRPYFRQSVTLVSQARALVTAVKAKGHKFADAVDTLQSALDKAIKALQDAKQGFDVTSIESNTTVHNAIDEAENEMQAAFNKYECTNEWTTVGKIATSRTDDETRLNVLKQKLTTTPSAPQRSGGDVQVTVTVKVYDTTNTFLRDSPYNLSKTTRLSGLLWNETTKHAGIDLLKSHFQRTAPESGQEVEKLSLDKDIDSLLEGETTLTMHLVTMA